MVGLMSSASREEREQRLASIEHLRAHVAELTAPWWSLVPVATIDAEGRPVMRHRRVKHAGLLAQFADVGRASDRDSGGPGKGPASRVVARIGVLDTEAMIRAEVREWALRIGSPVERAVDPWRALGFLMQRAPMLRSSDLDGLEQSARRWRHAARVALGYDDSPSEPQVPCMACGKRGGVRFTAEPRRAWCVNCSAEWDAITIAAFAAWCQQQEREQAEATASTETEQGERP